MSGASLDLPELAWYESEVETLIEDLRRERTGEWTVGPHVGGPVYEPPIRTQREYAARQALHSARDLKVRLEELAEAVAEETA